MPAAGPVRVPRTESPAPEAPAARGALARVLTEVREHPVAYGVIAAFAIAGPLYAAYYFPEAPLSLRLVGGLALGVYAAVCGVGNKFY